MEIGEVAAESTPLRQEAHTAAARPPASCGEKDDPFDALWGHPPLYPLFRWSKFTKRLGLVGENRITGDCNGAELPQSLR